MIYLVALCVLDQFNHSQSMYFYICKCIKKEIQIQVKSVGIGFDKGYFLVLINYCSWISLNLRRYTDLNDRETDFFVPLIVLVQIIDLI